jgi:predicted YcjX-like family ATPase
MSFNNPGILSYRYPIAVSGFRDSGKTVFLTSLVHHLLNHDPSGFDLDARRRVRLVNAGPVSAAKPRYWAASGKPSIESHDSQGFWANITAFLVRSCTRLLSILRKGNSSASAAHDSKSKGLMVRLFWEDFPYDANVGRLRSTPPEWQIKTVRPSHFQLRFQCTDWQWTTCTVDLYDIPGERFADSGIEAKQFSDWSDSHRRWSEKIPKPRPGAIDEFLKAYHKDVPPGENEYVRLYKLVLAELAGKHHLYLSPSTFVLDLDEVYLWDRHQDDIRNKHWEPILDARFSGLRNEEFAPLAPRHCKTELGKRFSKHYKAYRRKVTHDIFKTLKHCYSMMVLFDLAGILLTGPALCDEAERFSRDVLAAVDPGKRWWQSVLPWRLSKSIRRLAFAASQVDRFHRDDWGIVKRLVKKLTDKPAHSYAGAEPASFVCSAIKSTDSNSKEPTQLWALERGSDDPHRRVGEPLTVGRIPKEWGERNDWPEAWTKDIFQGDFPHVCPYMPAGRSGVSRHENLDDVFKFLMGYARRPAHQTGRLRQVVSLWKSLLSPRLLIVVALCALLLVFALYLLGVPRGR